MPHYLNKFRYTPIIVIWNHSNSYNRNIWFFVYSKHGPLKLNPHHRSRGWVAKGIDCQLHNNYFLFFLLWYGNLNTWELVYGFKVWNCTWDRTPIKNILKILKGKMLEYMIFFHIRFELISFTYHNIFINKNFCIINIIK